jgi:hypothetical protein
MFPFQVADGRSAHRCELHLDRVAKGVVVAPSLCLCAEVQDTKKSHRVKGHGGSSGVAGMACSWLACGIPLSQSVPTSKPIRDKKWVLGPCSRPMGSEMLVLFCGLTSSILATLPIFF